MFTFLKTIVQASKVAKEYQKRQEQYLKLPSEALKSLSDSELFEAVLTRTEKKVCSFDKLMDGLHSLSDPEQVFYVTSYYEAEVNNGGLCQFFVNSSREVAPLLSECLDKISASEHRKLFDDFILTNRITLNDLSSFVIQDIKEYESQTKRYPFDDFDNAFFTLTPIQEILPSYIRMHLTDF